MRLRPNRGHALILPLAEDLTHGDTGLIRHPDWVPICQRAEVVAIGSPEISKKRRDGKWITTRRTTDACVGDVVQFSGNTLGHEIAINEQTLRVLSFEQLDNCVILED